MLEFPLFCKTQLGSIRSLPIAPLVRFAVATHEHSIVCSILFFQLTASSAS
jgi:hypothetical protein